MSFLYTPEGQEIVAQNHYRPSQEDVLARHADSFPPVELFAIDKIAPGWAEAIKEFFDEGAVFDQIYETAAKGK